MALLNRATQNSPSRIVTARNLYFTAVAAVLCTVFYLIGNFRGGAAVTSAGIRPTLPCSEIPLLPESDRRSGLDFSARHAADAILRIPNLTAARVTHSPRCDLRFSEYTPCHDVERSLKFDREMLRYRERHCPEKGELLNCRIPAPHGYRTPFRWPESRDAAWYANVPHKHLTVEKAGQNWVRFHGDRFVFPGGGTMFPRGAAAYIDDIGKLIDLGDGSIRTAIDTGCGVASFGAYLLSREILPMSFAPKDTHEAQVQFALERGVPALIGIMASERLPYPARAFDIAHCSRCLIPWRGYDGLYLMEVDRILRPGGYWILSGPPVNWENHWKGWNRTRQDLDEEQKGIESVALSLCWKKLKQKNDIAIWQKPRNHLQCKQNKKNFCQDNDPDKAWYTKMEPCMTSLPEVSDSNEVSGGQLEKWPKRLTAIPPRIRRGTIDGAAPESFVEDTKLWKNRVKYYKSFNRHLDELGRYRNVVDMNAGFGGFAAALIDDPVWVMNVIPVEGNVDTLGVVYERGLIGTYQSWCEAMSTYPRTYDLIHADSVFRLYKGRCELRDILLEMDRILRPGRDVIIREDVDTIGEVKRLAEEMEWDTRMIDHEDGPFIREKILFATKSYWTAPSPDADQSKTAS